MLKPMLASALFAGLIAGLFAAGLQQAFLVPLITEAELYETGSLTHFGGAEAAGHAQEATAGHGQSAAASHSHEAAESDLSRTLLTVLMTVLTTCGFGLVLVAGFALAERWNLVRIDLRSGLMFGLAAFAATQLMPAMGLSPELPGAAAADLSARQIWWLATVVGTLAGLAMVAWGSPALKVAGALLIAAPHIWGAPHPHEFEGVVPPELSALFAARVLAVGALGWAALGLLAGHFWSREAQTA
jgi:cobalt transporter subunit CbtA